MRHAIPFAVLALLVTGVVARSVTTIRPPAQVESVRVLKLRLTADGGELATISTPSGMMATVAREGGETVGLTPGMLSDAVVLTVSVKDATGQFDAVGRYALVRNVPLDISTERTRLVVEWLDTVTYTPSGPGTTSTGEEPCTACCVFCDGITFCACDVVTTCGRCCCTGRCPCPPDANGRLVARGGRRTARLRAGSGRRSGAASAGDRPGAAITSGGCSLSR